MTNKNDKKIETEVQPRDAGSPARYEAPRITRKRSLERVTLASGVIAPGGAIGGN
jgi:hypothetical protein